MSRFQHAIILVRERSSELTLEELADCTGLHPELIERFVAFGLVQPVGARGGKAVYAVEAVTRLRVIERMRRDIGVNLAGIGVILDLLERIAAMEHELERLRRDLE